MSSCISNLSNQEITHLPNTLQGSELIIENLFKTTLKIFNFNLSAKISNCDSCKFIISPLSGLLNIENSRNCTISSASNEVFIDSSSNLKLFLFTETEPKIRSSSELKFAPFNIKFSGQESCFSEAQLNSFKDKWSEVYDLSRNDVSSNYELLSPKDFYEETFEFEGLGEATNPVPRHVHYGGSLTYEIIPYSKTHSYTVEKKELPPSSRVIHSETDTRKDVPFTRPLTLVESEIENKEETKLCKLALKYEYRKDKGFGQLDTRGYIESKETIEKCLDEFKVLLDQYYTERFEYAVGFFSSFIAMFICFMIMQVIRMSSDWLDSCVVSVFIILITSEICIIGIAATKWKKIKDYYLLQVAEFNVRKKSGFNDYYLEVIGTLDFVEIYINVKS